jgi:hypothetical protein
MVGLGDPGRSRLPIGAQTAPDPWRRGPGRPALAYEGSDALDLFGWEIRGGFDVHVTSKPTRIPRSEVRVVCGSTLEPKPPASPAPAVEGVGCPIEGQQTTRISLADGRERVGLLSASRSRQMGHPPEPKRTTCQRRESLVRLTPLGEHRPRLHPDQRLRGTPRETRPESARNTKARPAASAPRRQSLAVRYPPRSSWGGWQTADLATLQELSAIKRFRPSHPLGFVAHSITSPPRR